MTEECISKCPYLGVGVSSDDRAISIPIKFNHT
jgi:hypothetical protein